jgi:hypothetical protein
LSKIDIGNGLGCWKTIATRERSVVSTRSWMSSPSSSTSPERDALAVSSVRRLSVRSSVVLPQPDGPISASTSPWWIDSDTDLTASLPA